IVQHFGHRSQAVGRAAGVRDDGLAASQRVLIHTQYYGWDVAGSRRRNHYFLSTSRNVLTSTSLVYKAAGRFEHYVYAHVFPGQQFGVALGQSRDALTIYREAFLVVAHRAVKATVHRVVLKEVSQCFVIREVVDSHNLHVVAPEQRLEGEATNAAKAVNGDFNFCHGIGKNGSRLGRPSGTSEMWGEVAPDTDFNEPRLSRPTASGNDYSSPHRLGGLFTLHKKGK
nr:hypothetical protein [Tanacetum cinerariifolium]